MTANKTATTILFKNNKGCLVPIVGQNRALDKAFKDTAVREANIAAYNEYTKGFVSSNKSGFFASSSYAWDADNKTFNFTHLERATDEQLDNMFANAESFDASVSCDFTKPVNETVVSFINSNIKTPTIDDNGFYVSSMNWKYIVRNILKKKNTILIGPTGTGKTELIFEAAKQLGLECNTYDMGAMQDPLTDLLGTHRLVDGNSVFDTAKFVSDIQKPGIILLDELSRAPQMAMNILFPCLDSRRELRLDIADSGTVRKVKVHPECVFIATANIGAEYSGTDDIDAALLNRFLPLQLDYLPLDIEAHVLTARTGVSTSAAKQIATVAAEIRTAYNSDTITKSISTRETLNVAEMIADGFSFNDAFEFVVFQKFMDKDEVTTLKSLLVLV